MRYGELEVDDGTALLADRLETIAEHLETIAKVAEEWAKPRGIVTPPPVEMAPAPSILQAAKDVVIQRGRYYRNGVEDPDLSVVPRRALRRLDVALRLFGVRRP